MKLTDKKMTSLKMSNITKNELIGVTAVFVEFINKMYTRFGLSVPDEFDPDTEVERFYNTNKDR